MLFSWPNKLDKSLPRSLDICQNFGQCLKSDIRTIQVIGNTDPCKLPNTARFKSETNFPTILYPDLMNYLTFYKKNVQKTNKQTNKKNMNVWKTLDADNQVMSGWISDVAVLVKNGYDVVRAKVDL